MVVGIQTLYFSCIYRLAHEIWILLLHIRKKSKEGGTELSILTYPAGLEIENTRVTSFDIKFTRQGFENAC